MQLYTVWLPRDLPLCFLLGRWQLLVRQLTTQLRYLVEADNIGCGTMEQVSFCGGSAPTSLPVGFEKILYDILHSLGIVLIGNHLQMEMFSRTTSKIQHSLPITVL